MCAVSVWVVVDEGSLIKFIIIWCVCVFFFFKQKTAYEIGTGDWSSDVCSSDLHMYYDINFSNFTTRYQLHSYLSF